MARSQTPTGTDGPDPYPTRKHTIETLTVGDQIQTNVFVDTATVIDTYHDQTPYRATAKTVEARVDLEGPRGDHYTLTAGRFTDDEEIVSAQPADGGNPKRVTYIQPPDAERAATDSVLERARGQTPPDPSLPHRAEWTIRSIARRCCQGPGFDETVACAGTGDPVALTDPHLYVTARRDPARRDTTPGIEHYVLADPDALETWFTSTPATGGTRGERRNNGGIQDGDTE